MSEIIKSTFEKESRLSKGWSNMAITKLNLPLKQAIQITTETQYDSLAELKLPFEQAVQITMGCQYGALMKLKLPFEQAVQITTYSQYYALELKFPFDQAVQINSDNSFKCVNEKTSFFNGFICHNFGYLCEHMINKEDLLGCTSKINQSNQEDL